GDEHGGEQHHEAVGDRPADERGDHGEAFGAPRARSSTTRYSPFGVISNSNSTSAPGATFAGLPRASWNSIVLAPIFAVGMAPCERVTALSSIASTFPWPRWVVAAAGPPSVRRVAVALRLASESIRNCPETTTLRPASRPLRISV